MMFNKIIMIFRSFIARLLALLSNSRISFGATIYIYPGARLNIGRNVRIGKDCVIAVLPDASLIIGNGCIINGGSYIYAHDHIEIGENTRIAHYCSVIDHDYDFRKNAGLHLMPRISSSIVIGTNVWLGAYVMILKGVHIGDNTIVGAKTLVTKSIPNRKIVYCRQSSELTVKDLDSF